MKSASSSRLNSMLVVRISMIFRKCFTYGRTGSSILAWLRFLERTPPRNFMARPYLEATQNTTIDGDKMSQPGEIFSIGCGDGQVELEVIKYLLDHGEDKFIFTCADLSPILLARLRDAAAKKNYIRYIKIVEADLNLNPPDAQFDMIMAHHSLHHIVELERIFDYSKSHLKERGIFATNDMIGRNGHMRWPERRPVSSRPFGRC